MVFFRLSCVTSSLLPALVLAQMDAPKVFKCAACGVGTDIPCVYCGDTLRTAIVMLKEGRGNEFNFIDRSFIMRGYAREKRRDNPRKELLDEFFPLMKPFLGGKKEGKKPTSIGAAKKGVKAAKAAKKTAAKPVKKAAAK